MSTYTYKTTWYSWARLAESGAELNIDLDHHLRAMGWAFALVLFSFIILAFDTRHDSTLRTRPTYNLRDRIFGIEQRYFLAIFNGLLLYGALALILERH